MVTKRGDSQALSCDPIISLFVPAINPLVIVQSIASKCGESDDSPGEAPGYTFEGVAIVVGLAILGIPCTHLASSL